MFLLGAPFKTLTMIETLTDFINNSHAERNGNTWIVYCDGENKVGAISSCKGDNEFEAKEDAWAYYQQLKQALNK